jgi:hypothetical protein
VRRFLLALAVPALAAAVLAADRHVGERGQLALGLLAFAVLGAACTFVRPEVRLQAALVVPIAAVGEVLASLVWGLYDYRLSNVPVFVPPGHALVYLGGLAVTAAFARRRRLLVALAAVAAAGWGAAGLTVLPRDDAAGAVAAALFLVVLLRHPRASVYAGVFAVVAFIELYGTAVGAWAWRAEMPSLGLASGNPPSGAVAGYVLLEATAVRAAWWLTAAVAHGDGVQRALRARRRTRTRPSSRASRAAT